MDYNGKSLMQLVKDLTLTNEIELKDIPDMDLYAEQITSFFENKFGGSKRDEKDKILTRTMINNYTKSGLLMPPQNKKYNQRHIILLTLIYYLKNILTINDIHSLFRPILNNLATAEDDVISLEDIYSSFLELKRMEIESFSSDLLEKSKLIEEKTKKIDAENRELAEAFLTVIMLVAQANAQKKLAEKIIDSYFKN